MTSRLSLGVCVQPPRFAGAAWAAALGLGLAVGAAAAQGTELQVQLPMSGYATLQRLDIGDFDQAQFGPVFSGGRLSNGTLLPDVALTVSDSRNFAVQLPGGCTEDFCYPAESIQGNGAWQASARAGFGSLGVAASSTVGGRTTVGINYFGPGSVGIGASAVASYTESLSFESTALPTGSPVSFTVYSVVHAILVNPATVELQMGMLSSLSVTYAPTVLRPATGQQFELTPHAWHTTGGGEQWHGVLAGYEVQLGDIVSLKVTMDGRAVGVLEEDGPVWPDHNAVTFADGASVSAMNSLATGITVLTPGVALNTTSGHAYVLSVVPEPATVLLWLAGLAVCWRCTRRRGQCVAAAAVLSLSAAWGTANAAGTAPGGYRLTDLSVLLDAQYGAVSVASSRPVALNDAGQVVGYSTGGSWASNLTFIVTDGAVRTLTGLHIEASGQPRPLNNLGDVAGFFAAEQYGLRTAAVYSGNVLTMLDVPASPAVSQALAVGDSGQVVGTRRDGSRDRTFTLQNGQRTDFMSLSQAPVIVGINASGLIAGNRYAGNDFTPFLYDGVGVADLTPPPGAVAVRVTGLNDAGALSVNLVRDADICDIFGFCYNSPLSRAAVFDGDAYITIPTRDTDYPESVAINNRGVVAGNDDFGGWLWDGQAITYLDGVLGNVGVRPGTTRVLDINDAGQLLLAGKVTSYDRYWLLTPVPEPGAWAMLACGLAILAAARRWRRAGFDGPQTGAPTWPRA